MVKIDPEKKPQMDGLQHKNTKTSCVRKAILKLGPDLTPQLESIVTRHLFAAGMILSTGEVPLALKERSHG